MKAIYKLTHKRSKKVYIGQTKKHENINTTDFGYVHERFAEHLGAMLRGDHPNKNLAAVWRGKAADFKFEILEVVKNKEAKATENAYIRHYAAIPPGVFNIVKRGPNSPHITMEVRAEILRLLGTGMYGKDVAHQLGISTASVSLVKTGNKSVRAIARSERAKLYREVLKNPTYHTKDRHGGRGAKPKKGNLNFLRTLINNNVGLEHRSMFKTWCRENGYV